MYFYILYIYNMSNIIVSAAKNKKIKKINPKSGLG